MGRNGSLCKVNSLPAEPNKCLHPAKYRWNDRESGEVVCIAENCGEVLERMVSRTSFGDKFGRGPVNQAVFRKNLGSTSKQGSDKKGPEPIHQIAVASVRGSVKYHRRPLELIVKTCPQCKQENHVRVFGDPVTCENTSCGAYIVKCRRCGADNVMREVSEGRKCANCRKKLDGAQSEFVRTRLAEQVIRWMPVDGGKYGKNSSAVAYMADLIALANHWDPPEDDPVLKSAREVFSHRLDGQLSDEDAARVANVYMKSVKQLVKDQRKDLNGLFEGLLDSILIMQGVKT